MSRPPIPSQRNLSLTEELERLEQQITLTLQEIDHNFSRAHRIVTSSILPVVEQYSEQSRGVWEASKFWKQFFESSANVSLSGYEEQQFEDSGQDITATDDSIDTTRTSTEEVSESFDPVSPDNRHHGQPVADPDMSALSISDTHSTPRATRYAESHEDGTMDFSLTSDGLEGVSAIDTPSQMKKDTPSTPKRKPLRYQEDTSTTPDSADFPPPPSLQSNRTKLGDQPDPVLHHVLDKTYRVQATPLGGARTVFKVHPGTVTPKTCYNIESSPLSSPELEAPKLHSEIFSSPVAPESARRPRKPSKTRTPKPGISVLTPAKSKAPRQSYWDSDEDLEDDGRDPTAYFGLSPPKTMQFHIPQSKLLKTPAKEASKRIVSDLLNTAGGVDTTEEFDKLDYSPTVVGRMGKLEDDTF